MVRQRKKKVEQSENASPPTDGAESKRCWQWSDHISIVNVPLGVAIMLSLAYQYALFNNTLHENQLWFANIKVSTTQNKFWYIK